MMKLAFESTTLILPVSSAISILTDHAEICVEDIHYDETKRTVDISMHRRELTGFKKSPWGEQPLYGQTRIKSLLTIRQVDEISVDVDDRLVSGCNSRFTALFGLKMDEHQLYLGSSEEIQGKVLCQIVVKVEKISLEFRDETRE